MVLFFIIFVILVFNDFVNMIFLKFKSLKYQQSNLLSIFFSCCLFWLIDLGLLNSL